MMEREPFWTAPPCHRQFRWRKVRLPFRSPGQEHVHSGPLPIQESKATLGNSAPPLRHPQIMVGTEHRFNQHSDQLLEFIGRGLDGPKLRGWTSAAESLKLLIELFFRNRNHAQAFVATARFKPYATHAVETAGGLLRNATNAPMILPSRTAALELGLGFPTFPLMESTFVFGYHPDELRAKTGVVRLQRDAILVANDGGRLRNSSVTLCRAVAGYDEQLLRDGRTRALLPWINHAARTKFVPSLALAQAVELRGNRGVPAVPYVREFHFSFEPYTADLPRVMAALTPLEMWLRVNPVWGQMLLDSGFVASDET